ncbi:MAG TPA: alkaline phosphatase family protein [Acidobacteriaceae bacterium]|jgi:phospholipase C|nr:alkaline phosphatase family protein [Acidobacteriaceae bacterium]
MQKYVASALSALLSAGLMVSPVAADAQADSTPTATPIKHVVVIFGENISFDHYFGTYPNAKNPAGEPGFWAAPGTPSVNGLLTNGLMTSNPNFLNSSGNGQGATNPFRLDRSQAATADQDHNYTPEQEAFHGGLMDSFPEYTGTPGPPPTGDTTTGLTMGYYDGNTVTALWNYAQHYALNDNAYGTTFGPSTPGALNLISGQTNGVDDQVAAGSKVVNDGDGGYTDIGDADPIGDVCSTTTGAQISMSGSNIGDLLNSAGVSWGWFEGGFDLTRKNNNGTTGCARSTTSSVTGVAETDYIPHHDPFQYYSSTANLKHTRPSSVNTIGKQGDAANHQYDIYDFASAVIAGNMLAVSFLKAPGYQDAHAGYSDPLDEQAFVTEVIDFLQLTPEWNSTAVFINYDDSDGWYDHQLGQIINQSTTADDMLTGNGQCGSGTDSALPGPSGAPHAQGRCGYGPRIPLMLISPWAKSNFVDHTLADQTSIIHFIEDNWLAGKRLGGGSFDAIAGSVNNMFDFTHMENRGLFLLDPSSGELFRGGNYSSFRNWR